MPLSDDQVNELIKKWRATANDLRGRSRRLPYKAQSQKASYNMEASGIDACASELEKLHGDDG